MKPTSSPLPNYQPWQMTLYVMFAAQLLSIIGFSFSLPFLPFYIRELGVTEERLVPYWAGILAASASLVMVFFSPLWGWIADRYGRKPMVTRAMFGGAIITFAMGLVENIWQLLGLRMLSGALTGTISASIALVSTAVPRANLGFALGLMQVAVFLGMTMFREGEPHVVGTIFGVLILGVMNNGLNILQVNSYLQLVLTGVNILLAVLLSGLARR